MNSSLKRLLAFIDANGEVKGRKKLQKLIYIFKHLGLYFKEDYSYHYYGPYSSTLQMEIESLVNSGFVEEKMEGNTYEYCLSKEGKELKEEEGFKEEHIKLMRYLNQKPAYILELVSVFFYLEEKGYVGESAIKKKTEILKPELKENINEAYALFCEIKEYPI